MSSSHQFAIMSLQSLEENYHEDYYLFIVFCNIGNCLWKGLNVLAISQHHLL